MMNGKKIFYWHIMTQMTMNNIAAQVPMSIDELNELGIVGENVAAEYGERLIRMIRSFIEQNQLHKYIDAKRENKRQRTQQDRSMSNGPISSEDSIAVLDEFAGIDVDFFSIPDRNPTNQSVYFQK